MTDVRALVSELQADEECIHGLVGCAPCSGTDDLDLRDLARGGNSRLWEKPWTDEERSFAAKADLTSAQVAGFTGRSSKQVAAFRIKQLGMDSWAGNNHIPGIPRRAVIV